MNNNVDCEALILGLRPIVKLEIKILIIYGDSLLIMNQVLGIYQFHNKLLESYREEVINLLKLFNTYKIESTPRSSNYFEDTIASLGLLIPHYPHRWIQHMKIMSLNDSSLNLSSPSPLVEASINEILVES